MNSILIGYFTRRPWNQAEDQRRLPPQIEELCNVGHRQSGGPRRWIDLWLHNRFWIYSTEAQAWAAEGGRWFRAAHQRCVRSGGAEIVRRVLGRSSALRAHPGGAAGRKECVQLLRKATTTLKSPTGDNAAKP